MKVTCDGVMDIDSGNDVHLEMKSEYLNGYSGSNGNLVVNPI